MKFLVLFFFPFGAFAELNKVVSIDQIEIVENGICQIRQATKVIDNGVEIAKTYHRWSVEPGGDLSQYDKRTQTICKSAWTSEVIKKYKEQLKKNIQGMGK
jgi:hypothetical protein